MEIIGIIIIVLLVIANINLARLNNNAIKIALTYARYLDRSEKR